MRSFNLTMTLTAAACASLTSAASAGIVVDSRNSEIIGSTFAGNGPIINQGSTSLTETGLLTDWAEQVDRPEILNDAFWGAGNARAQVAQTIDITAFGSDGLLVDGQMRVNRSSATATALSLVDTQPIVNAATNNLFEYIFTLSEPTAYAITVNANRNPFADFSVVLRYLSAGSIAYLSPLSEPVVDAVDGVLPAGQYLFRARATSRASAITLGVTADDSAFNDFTLQLGVVPGPGVSALFGVGLLSLGRRRR